MPTDSGDLDAIVDAALTSLAGNSSAHARCDRKALLAGLDRLGCAAVASKGVCSPAADILEIMDLSLDSMRQAMPPDTPLVFFTRLRASAQEDLRHQAINPAFHHQAQSDRSTGTIVKFWCGSAIFGLLVVAPLILLICSRDLDGSASVIEAGIANELNAQRLLWCTIPQLFCIAVSFVGMYKLSVRLGLDLIQERSEDANLKEAVKNSLVNQAYPRR